MTPMHMGALHPYELALTLLLAFGPIVVLAAVIVVRSREDRRDRNEPADRQVLENDPVN